MQAPGKEDGRRQQADAESVRKQPNALRGSAERLLPLRPADVVIDLRRGAGGTLGALDGAPRCKSRPLPPAGRITIEQHLTSTCHDCWAARAVVRPTWTRMAVSSMARRAKPGATDAFASGAVAAAVAPRRWTATPPRHRVPAPRRAESARAAAARWYGRATCRPVASSPKPHRANRARLDPAPRSKEVAAWTQPSGDAGLDGKAPPLEEELASAFRGMVAEPLPVRRVRCHRFKPHCRRKIPAPSGSRAGAKRRRRHCPRSWRRPRRAASKARHR